MRVSSSKKICVTQLDWPKLDMRLLSNLFIYLKYIYFILSNFIQIKSQGEASGSQWSGLGENGWYELPVLWGHADYYHTNWTLKSSLRFSLSLHSTSSSLLIIRFSFSTHSHRGRAERGGERNKAFKSPVPRVPALHTLVCVMSVTFVILCVCV